MSVAAQTVAASDTESVVVGTVEKIDHVAKTVAVKTADGTVKVFKWTKRTTVHGIKEAVVWSEREARVGEHVVVHTVKVGAEDTIKAIKWFGKGTVRVAEATVKTITRDGKKVGLAVEGEAEKVYDVSSHAVVKTSKSIGHGTQHLAKNVKKEAKVVAHFFHDGEKEVVHFIAHKD